MPEPFGDAAAARERIAAVQSRLDGRRIVFRAPPPEPTTCCERGCDGCVWAGWHAAVGWWLEDAAGLLSS